MLCRAALLIVMTAPLATAQIAIPSTVEQPVATLADQLINRLRATTGEQQQFVRDVVGRTERGQLDPALVLAVQRYAIRRRSDFPFPFFERALRFEAAKRGVNIPAVRRIVAGDLAGN